MLSRLIADSPNCVIVDSGNLTNTTEKLEVIAGLLSAWKYDAVGVGTTDLAIPDFFKRAVDSKLNVLYAAPDAPSGTLPYVVKNVGGVRVGIVSFGGARLNAGGSDFALRKSLYSALKAARDSCDILILLDQANIATDDWLQRNGPRLGVPDVVIGGAAKSGIPGEQVVGATHIVQTSTQAKAVGVVDIEISSAGERKFTAQLMQLDESVPEDEATKKYISEFMAKTQHSAPVTPPSGPMAASKTSPPPSTRPYFASEGCKTCHMRQYEDWQQSGHSQAVQKLAQANRRMPECLGCHSEAYRSLRDMAALGGNAAGVECSSCHAASLPHGMDRKNTSVRAKVDPKLCVDCHTKDWSPDYEEKSYLAKVSHLQKAAESATAGAK